jgi:hypothetical protein
MLFVGKRNKEERAGPGLPPVSSNLKLSAPEGRRKHQTGGAVVTATQKEAIRVWK